MASVTRYSPGYPVVITGYEAASQSFKEGDLVHINSDGLIEIATAGNIDGIARQDASGTTSAAIPIELIELDAIYSAHYKASATAQTLCGILMDFVFTVGAHTLDDDGASTDAVSLQLDPRDALGTSGGRILFRFLPALVKG
ncbi:MAG: hypothetical protein WC455_27450 [Dehalococcoidia bacterium]|jgi:hypothetical protein